MKKSILMIIAIILCLLTMLVLSSCSANTSDSSSEFENLENQIATLKDENNNLKNDLIELENLLKNQDETPSDEEVSIFPLYNEWIDTENSQSNRDMYESIIEGFLVVGDEISRGWVDDGTIKFLVLLKGTGALNTSSYSAVHSVYKSLDSNIQYTEYCIRDFFTVTSYDVPTADGIYRFLDAIDQLENYKFNGEDLVKKNSSGDIISFAFDNEIVASALGVSVELVDIMTYTAIDAGFDVVMN